MRTFDYGNLPKGLFKGRAMDLVALLHEEKGRVDMLKQTRAAELGALSEQAHFENVDASTRVEGMYPDRRRVRAVIAGAEPESELEAQVAGYSHALRLIEDEAGELDLTAGTVLRLYEELFAHRDLGRKSRYRKKDYIYVQVDGRPQAMPVSPITAFETPLVFGGACDSLAEAFDGEAGSSLALIAVFTIDLLCIRPFEEGNGRISRLFAELLLAKAGFDVFRYVGLDRLIEQAGMEYYDALNACVEGWDRGENDYRPYVLFWLETLHTAYAKLLALFDDGAPDARGKTARVMRYVQSAAAPVTKRQLREAFPEISEATIENALGKMVRDGLVDKLGAGRSTAYLWR